MSLFPAYSSWDAFQRSVAEDRQWLTNSSFTISPSTYRGRTVVTKPKRPINRDSISKKAKKRYKWLERRHELRRERREHRKYLKRHPVVHLIVEECDLYYIDKTRRLDFLHCSTLTRPFKPRYRSLKKNLIGPSVEPDVDKFKRYYMLKHGMRKNDLMVERASKAVAAINTAAEFNKKLCKESSVAEWIAFVDFQDEFYNTQELKYKTEAERKAAVQRKKLDILLKAMNFNPDNEELLSHWVKIGSQVLSSDEMSTSLWKMIEFFPGRLSLWLALIAVKQHSLALCTYPSVTALYKNAINCLKNIKTDRPADRDSDILELLYHYGKFLQDTGHWEVLWSIFDNNIRLNFGLNLNMELNIDDMRVRDQENSIISGSRLPVWMIWRLAEGYREGLHFLPLAEAALYPQRVVVLNDLMDFILHLHRDVHLTLIIKFLMLLKVPPLPFNTAIAKALNKTGWVSNLDSPEFMLATAFNAGDPTINFNYLKYLAQLTTGPQYMRRADGHEQFLELIHNTFQQFMRVLEGRKKIFVGLWWLRFNRWLYILRKHALASLQLPARRTRNFFKDFIRRPENRDNLLYYCEYSQYGINEGNIDGSIRTLKTVMGARRAVYQLTDDLEKAALCQVHRYLCELYILKGQKEEAMKVLTVLAVGSSSNSDSRRLALNKYENNMFDLIEEIRNASDSLEHILLPQFPLEWIHCYLWLLALSDSAACAKSLYLRVDSKLADRDNSYSSYAREYICEAMSTIFWMTEKNDELSLMNVIQTGLTQFPYNLKLLSLLATKKLKEHGLWGVYKQAFLNPPSIFGCVVLICVSLLRHETDKEIFGNRLNSLLLQLCENEGKQSSVIHRLRLFFLLSYDHSLINAASVNAIEACPWNKSVFSSIVSVSPNQLLDMTDILIEKEFRVHITPDEINALRS